MKKIIAISLLLLAVLILAPVSEVQAQKQYSFVGRQTATLTSAAAISITPKATQIIYTLSATHAPTINAVTTYSIPGDVVYLKITATSAQRIVTFGTNLNALVDTIASGKTKMYEFIYTGSAYDIVASAATD